MCLCTVSVTNIPAAYSMFYKSCIQSVSNVLFFLGVGTAVRKTRVICSALTIVDISSKVIGFKQSTLTALL